MVNEGNLEVFHIFDIIASIFSLKGEGGGSGPELLEG